MLREIEPAALTGKDVEVSSRVGCGTATVHIRESKTDTSAVGAARSLQCTCPARTCPVAAARGLALGKQPLQRLVTTRDNKIASKAMMIEAMKARSTSGHGGCK